MIEKIEEKIKYNSKVSPLENCKYRDTAWQK